MAQSICCRDTESSRQPNNTVVHNPIVVLFLAAFLIHRLKHASNLLPNFLFNPLWTVIDGSIGDESFPISTRICKFWQSTECI